MKKNIWINGQYVETENYSELLSPYSQEKIADIAIANKIQTQNAIQVAYDAKEVMAKMPAHQRAAILEKVSQLLEENLEEAARVIALESAKPLIFAKAEVIRTIETYKFASEEAKRIHGETIPFDAAVGGVGKIGYTIRNPIGVIGAITPFNFPMNLVAHKVGPAIASGNTVVLKPASQTPLSAFYIADLFKKAGLPDGALNVVTGPGRVVGDAIVESDLVNMVTFTGSSSVGIALRAKAGLKKTTLELGSNAALIIDENIDVKKALDRCLMGAFSNQGQVCISLQRMYVHEKIYDEFVSQFAQAASKLKLGDPLDPETYVSSLISPNDLDRTLSWIEEAKAQGATIAAGGKTQGNILEPTVILDVTRNMKVSCNEVFAPIVSICKVSSIEEAIDAVNDSRYGLQAGIYTNSVFNAHKAADDLHVGGVVINDVPTFRVDQMPYGGVKESGTGREGLKYAIEEMTEMKLVIWHKG
ncbi:aldehyde dehydrogenase family protein [Bacillus sp. AFS041924]|uniref:aldehyde dehydrogenase family protein n=1 Tax=Bacillus sp. AFS041924 TaxID=2033503 RepID=UPI000BFB6FF2|nr:aldehyde dehydrogenase family protein [Bacillus sp. AFS041924]PGS51774.1 aldehyde dehydrogenase [Bacillus sp. AFS041924]